MVKWGVVFYAWKANKKPLQQSSCPDNKSGGWWGWWNVVLMLAIVPQLGTNDRPQEPCGSGIYVHCSLVPSRLGCTAVLAKNACWEPGLHQSRVQFTHWLWLAKVSVWALPLGRVKVQSPAGWPQEFTLRGQWWFWMRATVQTRDQKRKDQSRERQLVWISVLHQSENLYIGVHGISGVKKELFKESLTIYE